MTTGDKIKYLRKQLGITQAQLADMSGIHIVTIKKYETNKVQPLPAQIERLSSALRVGCFALTGIGQAKPRIQTVGDLLGFIIEFCKRGFFTFTGQRDSDLMLIAETAGLQINPIFANYFEFFSNKDRINVSSLFFKLKFESFFYDLLRWEHVCFLYDKAIVDAGNNPNASTKATLEDFKNKIDLIELEMQKSQILIKF